MGGTSITNPAGYDDPETAALTFMRLLVGLLTPETANPVGPLVRHYCHSGRAGTALPPP